MKRWNKHCVSIRVYQGIADTDPTTSHHRMVLAAVAKHGNDLPDIGECADDSQDDPVLDNSTRCPDYCFINNPLLQ